MGRMKTLEKEHVTEEVRPIQENQFFWDTEVKEIYGSQENSASGVKRVNRFS
jgi:hypothetical protein